MNDDARLSRQFASGHIPFFRRIIDQKATHLGAELAQWLVIAAALSLVLSTRDRRHALHRLQGPGLGAMVHGLLLMAHFKGQLVVSDFGFYGRDCHVSLIRGKRLIAGVNFFAELPVKLRQAALLIGDKAPEWNDARRCGDDRPLQGARPRSQYFKDFVQGAPA